MDMSAIPWRTKIVQLYFEKCIDAEVISARIQSIQTSGSMIRRFIRRFQKTDPVHDLPEPNSTRTEENIELVLNSREEEQGLFIPWRSLQVNVSRELLHCIRKRYLDQQPQKVHLVQEIKLIDYE